MSMFVNFVTNPTAGRLVQSAFVQVPSEGALKAVGRPAFTLIDKNAEPETRKYAAVREFLYQSMCIASYAVIFYPIFKMAGYKAMRKYIFPHEKFELFKPKTVGEFYKNLETQKKKNVDVSVAKGAMEALSILGSAITLTIISPQIVNKMMPSMMKIVDGKINKNKKTSENVTIDKKA